MRERSHRERIDETAVAVFLAGLEGMTPRKMTQRARALARLVHDAPDRPDLPVSPATLAEALRRVRACLIEER